MSSNQRRLSPDFLPVASVNGKDVVVVKVNKSALIQFMQPSLVRRFVYFTDKPRPVAGEAVTLPRSIFVDREPGRVDPHSDEVVVADMLLQHRMRNLEVVGILGVHGNAVD